MTDNYTMADVQRAVAQSVAKPVLDYLTQQTGADYFVKSTHASSDFSSDNTFRVKTSGLYKGIFGRTICEITLEDNRGSELDVELKSFSTLLPQQKLEDLMKDVKVYEIVMAGAFKSRAALDYQ